jgi:hypothetical protein
MVASIQLADVGARHVPGVLRASPEPRDVPGLIYADTTITAPLGGGLLPRPRPGRVGLVAFWDDAAALDRFLATSPVAARFADGLLVRLAPVRASGGWSAIGTLVESEIPVEDHEPVAVLTYGRLRARRAGAFLRTSAKAEQQVVEHPALALGTGLARPPQIVSTFSIWKSAAGMRDYAYSGSGHVGALRAVAQNDFHHESMFVRFRPYGVVGDWDGAALPDSLRTPALS